MRILVIGPLPQPVFGVSLSNMVLINGLIKRGHQIENINTSGGKKIDSEIGSWDYRKLSFVKSYLQIYKIFSADIIYTTPGQTFLGILKYSPFILISKMLGRKIIIHVKGGYLKESYLLMNSFKKSIFKNIISLFDGGIVLSKSLVSLLDTFLPKDKIFIQHNFIQDSLRIPKDQIKQNKSFKTLRIIYLSNLMHEKGIGELLAALELLEQNNIIFHAKIAGNIPKDQDKLYARLNSLKNTEYLGVVEKEKKTELLIWGNVFCLPTYYSMEGQPISIIEAMGFGNLILTTRHAGIPDICTTENAIFVQKRDANAILHELTKLSKNLSLVHKIGINNMDYSLSKFTEDDFVEGILEVMNKVK